MPPLTSCRPPASSVSASALALSMICWAYCLELGPQRLAEADRLAGDDVHQRPALDAGEHAAVDRLAVLFLRQAQAGPRAAERLVRRGGDEVGDRHRVVVQPGGDQAGVVGHVDDQLRADLAGDLGELAVRNLARIGARAGDDQLRLVLAGQRGDLVEVDAVACRASRRS